MNCWEYKRCGREAGGSRVAELGVCPAYPHHGRRCAFVAGTLCPEARGRSAASKPAHCASCAFFRSPFHERPDAGGERAMAICPHLSTCTLHAKLRLECTRTFWTEKYCHAEPSRCARLKLSLEGRAIPDALLPSGQLLAVGR